MLKVWRSDGGEKVIVQNWLSLEYRARFQREVSLLLEIPGFR